MDVSAKAQSLEHLGSAIAAAFHTVPLYLPFQSPSRVLSPFLMFYHNDLSASCRLRATTSCCGIDVLLKPLLLGG